MRIGIDVRKIRDTGIGRYIENLVDGLLRMDQRNEYILYFAPDDAERYSYPEDRVTKQVERADKYSIAEHWSLAAKAKKDGVNLFHAPHYVLPFFMKTPSVVTVHDLIHVREEWFGPAARAYARFMIGSAAARARMVIAVSESTKKDLMSILEVNEKKIRVIPNGGGDFHRPPEDELERALHSMGLAPGYFLFVGSDRPHKNLTAVEKALEAMSGDTMFVIVGRVGEARKESFRKFGDRARFLNNLDKKMMEALYSGASALFFPSLYEGFGLPPLEAMACGTPVVASNRSSVPEVVGDAAELADPEDFAGMSSLLERIRKDVALRDGMIKKGRDRVALFSWDKTAMMTLDVYEEALT